MNYNERFFILFDILKKAGRIKSYVQLADIVGTNKAGINDIKSGKKRVTLDNIKSMILSYPDINLYWFITGKGDVLDENFIIKSNKDNSNKELINKVCELSVENAELKRDKEKLTQEIDKLKKDKSKSYESVQHSVNLAAEPKLTK